MKIHINPLAILIYFAGESCERWWVFRRISQSKAAGTTEDLIYSVVKAILSARRLTMATMARLKGVGKTWQSISRPVVYVSTSARHGHKIVYIYKLYNMTMSMIYYDPQQLKVIYHGFSVPFFKESSWKWWPSFYVFLGALNGFYMNHAPASNHSLLYPILVPLQSKQQPTLQELIVLCVFKTFCFLSLSIFF